MRFVSFRPASSVIATTALLLIATAPSQAQTRAETLRYVTGASVNTLDPNIPGSTRESFGLSMSTYDRLVARSFEKIRQSSRGLPAVLIRLLDGLTRIMERTTA